MGLHEETKKRIEKDVDVARVKAGCHNKIHKTKTGEKK